MLIFKNLKFRFFKWFWLKTKTFFKYALGIKRSSTRQQNLYRFFWRFLFIGFLLFILFSNKSPWGYLSTGKKTDTISLYAGTVIGNFENNAWLNIDNAKGAAEIGPDEDLILFNVDNSAVYQGGDGDVVLSNWLPLTLGEDNLSENELPLPYTWENESDGEIADEQTLNEELATSTMETALPEPAIPVEASTTNNIIFENKASSSNSSLGPEKNWIGFDEAIDDDSSAGAQTFGQDEHPASEENQVEVIDISQESIDAIDNIEIIDEAGEIESPASQNETELSNDLSWINDIFQAKEAQAQEYISNEPEKLSDLGIFQKASLKISLAAFNNMQKQIEDLKEAEIIDNDAADNSSGVGEQAGRTNEEESTDTSGNETNEEDSFIKASSTEEISQGYWWDKFVNYAQAQDDYEPKISIWYSLDQRTGTLGRVIWEQLDTISADRISNKLNDGYLSWELPAIESWDSLDDLQIKIKGEYGGGTEFVLYLDSLWLEVEYEKESEMDILEKRQRWEEALEKLTKQLVLQMDKNGKMNFRYHKNENRVWDNLAELLGIGNYWEDVDISAKIIDGNGQALEFPLSMVFAEDGEFVINIPPAERQLRPGKYAIEISIIDNSGDEVEEFVYYQEFNWGVLAFNTNKATYSPGDKAYLQMAVLDDFGNTICDADLTLAIITPDRGLTELSTADGTIIRNSECGPNNVIDSPDYYAYYDIESEGGYELTLLANTASGQREIIDNFNVVPDLDYDIERIAPTRIYPWSDYSTAIKLIANKDYTGAIKEYVPNGFRIVSQTMEIRNRISGVFENYSQEIGSSSREYKFDINNSVIEKELVWSELELEKGDEIRIKYIFDAPDLSPELYLIGPLTLDDFAEARQWQIAADAQTGIVMSENIAIDGGTSDTVAWKTITTASSTNFVSGEKYFVYVTAGFAGNTTAISTDFEIVYGSTVQYTGLIEAPGPAYSAQQISWFDIYDQPATPNDISIRYRTNSGTSYALNAQILAVSLSDLSVDDWRFAENTTQTTHTITMAAQSSITLNTADGVKDWLVFGMEEVIVDSTGRSYEGEIYDGASSYMVTLREGENAAELVPYAIFRSFDNVATNTQFSFRSRDDQQGVNQHAASKIFALNLDVFEDHKTHYADINTALATNPSWTEIANLNSGGNYLPQTAGDQIIFASWINNVAASDVGTNDRLQVNSASVPANWSWNPTPVVGKTSYDSTDQLLNNIVAKVNIPTSGYSINLGASEITGTAQVADEVSMTVFSVKKKSVNPPTGDFGTTTPRTDSSGVVDIEILVADGDIDDCRAKIEYSTSSDCTAPWHDSTIDSNPSNVSAEFGAVPTIDNSFPYQIGTSSNFIITSSGENIIGFDWLSETDEPNADDTYCIRLTVNDFKYDQAISATTTVLLDNAAPTSPGVLSLDSRTGTTVTMVLGATSTETNFMDYRIYYKVYDGTDPEEGDAVLSSSTDANLGNIDFNGASTTFIDGLSSKTTYSFAIWVYDWYGHKASSARVDILTNDAPTGSFNSAYQKTDGSREVAVSIEVADDNQDNCQAKIDYVAGSACDFSIPLKPTLDESSVGSDYGTVVIDNSEDYQVGSSTGWITTPGSNTVTFDWLEETDEEFADGQFCLQLTVNDNTDSQLLSTTTVLTLDNINPTPPGSLTAGTVGTSSITLVFASTTPSTDTNEPSANAYKIYRKQGTSGVTEGGTEHDDAVLDSYDYSGASFTTVNGLNQDTWYVFNIWSYDSFGNKASASEIAIKTNITLTNDSLTFVNPQSQGPDTNIVVADNSSEWIIRAVVSEANGYLSLASTTLRLANKEDDTPPYKDLEFYWNQSGEAFYEIGSDNQNSASLSANSSSTCAGLSCTIDFHIIFFKNFATTSLDYSAELYSTNDFGNSDSDSYTDFYQVRYPYSSQIHYRWRNDDGGE